MERYLSLPTYLKSKYGRKLYRVALDANMTCPNRDGKIGNRGCIFCGEGGSGDFAIKYDGQKLHKEDLIYNHQTCNEGDYIAYFQSYTNTYAPIERLEYLFTKALEDDLFAGIAIGTRADCLGDDVINLLDKLRKKYPNKFIWIEIGLQSIHQNSADFIRRGYNLDVFDEAVKKLKKIDVEVIVHIIIGLPNESEKMIYETINHLNDLKIDGIKIHLLHYLKDTDLGNLYLVNPHAFKILSKEEYVHIVSECIARLNEDIVIHRLTGDGNGEMLLAPKWSEDKRSVINAINHELKKNNIIQGNKKTVL